MGNKSESENKRASLVKRLLKRRSILPPIDSILTEICKIHPKIISEYSDDQLEQLYIFNKILQISQNLHLNTLHKLVCFENFMNLCVKEFENDKYCLFYYIFYKLKNPFIFVPKIKKTTSLPIIFQELN